MLKNPKIAHKWGSIHRQIVDEEFKAENSEYYDDNFCGCFI